MCTFLFGFSMVPYRKQVLAARMWRSDWWLFVCCIARSCFSACENWFDKKHWRTFCKEWGIDADRPQVVAAGRYEDDLCMCSFLLCPACLHKVICKVYAGEPMFECNPNHHVVTNGICKNRFMDMLVHLAWERRWTWWRGKQPRHWHIDLYHANLDYIRGVADSPQKHRFAAPVGSQRAIIENCA